MLSLDRRVSLALVFGTAVFVALAAGLVWTIYRPLVWNRIDADLARWAEGMVPFIWRQVRSFEEDGNEPVELLWRRDDATLMIGVVRLADGQIIGQRHFGTAPDWHRLGAETNSGALLDFDQRMWRVWLLPVTLAAFPEPDGSRSHRGRRWPPPAVPFLEPPHDHCLILLRDVDAVLVEERRAGLALLALVVTATVLAGFGARLLTRTVLRPVAALGRAIATMGGSGQRLVPGMLPRELHIVPDHLNQLLDRIDAARERERRFHAAAAHELRTPLAGLLAQLEVALMRERSGAEYRQTLVACQEVGIALQDLVARLLQWARCEAGAALAVTEALAVRPLWEQVLRGHAAALGERGWPLAATWAEDLPPVRAARELVVQIADSLVANALAHGSGPGCLRIVATSDAEVVSIRMENPSPEPPALPPEDLKRPFVSGRGDGGLGHVGLGLALVEDLLSVLGGRLELHWNDGYFAAVCQLPRWSGRKHQKA